MTDASTTPDLINIAARDWQKARRRLAVIRDLAELSDRTRADAEAAAAELNMSLSQLYRMLRRYEADPRLTSLLPDRRGPQVGRIRLPPEVDEVINATIDEYYLSRQRPRVSDLLVEVRRRCRALGYHAPGRKSLRLRLAQRPAAKIAAQRFGRKAARDRFGAAPGSLDAPWPLSLVQIDHPPVDVIVVDSVTRQPIQRPWLTIAIDVHSRCVAGFHLSLDPPSATSVALCVAHAGVAEGRLADGAQH
jgi:putative transposase